MFVWPDDRQNEEPRKPLANADMDWDLLDRQGFDAQAARQVYATASPTTLGAKIMETNNGTQANRERWLAATVVLQRHNQGECLPARLVDEAKQVCSLPRHLLAD